MSAELERFNSAFNLAASQVDQAIQRISAIGDRTELAHARIALDAAKEMAKLNQMSSQLRMRLTRLECHIARRAGQLGVTVKGVTAATANWFSGMTDSEIDDLISRHSGKAVAASVMRAELALSEFKKSRAHAVSSSTIERLKVADAGETLTALITAAQDDFYDRDDANPHVADTLESLADSWLLLHDRIGVKALFERCRWESGIQTRGDIWRLNNSWTSFYARLLIERRPEWQDAICLREQRAAA